MTKAKLAAAGPKVRDVYSDTEYDLKDLSDMPVSATESPAEGEVMMDLDSPSGDQVTQSVFPDPDLRFITDGDGNTYIMPPNTTQYEEI